MANTNKQIMVVDDEKGLRTLLTIMLERAGFLVLQAPDAATALEIRSYNRPDLYVLDIMLPDINGIELCRILRQSPDAASTPVLMLSSRSDYDSVRASYDAGANDYLQKPVMQRDLLRKVDSLLLSNPERPSHISPGREARYSLHK